MAVAGSIASRHKGGARSSKQAFHYILHYSSSPENKGKWLAIKRWQRDTFPPHTQHTVWPIKFSRNLSWLELDCWCAKMKTKTSTTNCFILERVRQRKKSLFKSEGTSRTEPPKRCHPWGPHGSALHLGSAPEGSLKKALIQLLKKDIWTKLMLQY